VVIIARPCPHEFGFLGEGIAGHAGGSGREKAGGGPAEIPISRPKCNKKEEVECLKNTVQYIPTVRNDQKIIY